MQSPGVGGNKVCSENKEMSGVAGAERVSECWGWGGHIKGPAKTHSCWVRNPLYSGSYEKPLEGSNN